MINSGLWFKMWSSSDWIECVQCLVWTDTSFLLVSENVKHENLLLVLLKICLWFSVSLWQIYWFFPFLSFLLISTCFYLCLLIFTYFYLFLPIFNCSYLFLLAYSTYFYSVFTCFNLVLLILTCLFNWFLLIFIYFYLIKLVSTYFCLLIQLISTCFYLFLIVYTLLLVSTNCILLVFFLSLLVSTFFANITVIPRFSCLHLGSLHPRILPKKSESKFP